MMIKHCIIYFDFSHIEYERMKKFFGGKINLLIEKEKIFWKISILI